MAHDKMAAHEQALERYESHQAEQPPLVWSDVQHAYRPSNAQVPSPSSRNELPSSGLAVEKKDNEPIYVTFEDGDPENPFEWSHKRKW